MQSSNNTGYFFLESSEPSNTMQLKIASVVSQAGTTATHYIDMTNPIEDDTTNSLAPSDIINQPHDIGQTNQNIGGNTTGSMLSPDAEMVEYHKALLIKLLDGTYVTVIGQVMEVFNPDGEEQSLTVSADPGRPLIESIGRERVLSTGLMMVDVVGDDNDSALDTEDQSVPLDAELSINMDNYVDKPGAPDQPEPADWYKDHTYLGSTAAILDDGSLLSYVIGNQAADVPASSSQYNVTVPHLNENIEYEFCARAGPDETNQPNKTVIPKPKKSKPGKPEGPLGMSNIRKGGCNLKWKKPKDDGGNKIDAYLVQKFNPDVGIWFPVGITDSTVLAMEVDGLILGHKYKFRVKAVSKGGESEPLESFVSIINRDPFVVPPAPSAPEPSDWSAEHIDLIWKEPSSDGGSPITGYIIEMKDKSSATWQKALVTTLPTPAATVSGLIEGNEYQFHVIAVNGVGQSAPSEAGRTFVAKPRYLAPKIERKNLIDITVSAGKVLEYDVDIIGEPPPHVEWHFGNMKLNASKTITIDNGEYNSKLVIRPTKRCDSGEYKIIAKNSSGTDSNTVKVIVIDKPNPPEGPLVVSDVQIKGCKLKWKHPKDDGGTPIKYYRIDKKDTTENGCWVPVGRSSEHSFDVTKLTPDKKYKFRVTAVNAEGKSEPLILEHAIVAKNQFAKPRNQAPRIDRNNLLDARIEAGQSFNFDIKVSGEPTPTIKWLLNYRDIRPNQRVQIQHTDCNTKINVCNATRADSGTYTISAENSHGSDTADVKVTILDAPSPPQGPPSKIKARRNQLISPKFHSWQCEKPNSNKRKLPISPEDDGKLAKIARRGNDTHRDIRRSTEPRAKTKKYADDTDALAKNKAPRRSTVSAMQQSNLQRTQQRATPEKEKTQSQGEKTKENKLIQRKASTKSEKIKKTIGGCTTKNNRHDMTVAQPLAPRKSSQAHHTQLIRTSSVTSVGANSKLQNVPPIALEIVKGNGRLQQQRLSSKPYSTGPSDNIAEQTKSDILTIDLTNDDEPELVTKTNYNNIVTKTEPK